jgi:hypothetical protein
MVKDRCVEGLRLTEHLVFQPNMTTCRTATVIPTASPTTLILWPLFSRSHVGVQTWFPPRATRPTQTIVTLRAPGIPRIGVAAILSLPT